MSHFVYGITVFAALCGFVLCGGGCASQGTARVDAGQPDSPQTGDPRVRLRWRTETETDAFGFFVFRAETASATAQCLNLDDPLHAAGTTTAPQNYVYYDLAVEMGKTYYYHLIQADRGGQRECIVGCPAPVPGKAKPLTDVEAAEIRRQGTMFRHQDL